MKGDFVLDQLSPELVVPCELIDETIGEPVLSVYLNWPPERASEVVVAVDPGESKAGFVLAVEDDVLFVGLSTPEAISRIIRVLSAHYRKVVLMVGRTPSSERLLAGNPPNVNVVFLEEANLPPLKLGGKFKDDALDALRLYLKGRALLVQKAVQDATSSS